MDGMEEKPTDTIAMLSQAVASGALPKKAATALQAAATFYHDLGQVLCFILGHALPDDIQQVTSVADIMTFKNAAKLEAALTAHQKTVQKLTSKYI